MKRKRRPESVQTRFGDDIQSHASILLGSLSVARLLLSVASRAQRVELERNTEYRPERNTASDRHLQLQPRQHVCLNTCMISAAALLLLPRRLTRSSCSHCSFLVSHSHSSLVVPRSFSGFPSYQLPLSLRSTLYLSCLCSPNHRSTTLHSRCHARLHDLLLHLPPVDPFFRLRDHGPAGSSSQE